jgi:phosphoglycerol transferase MdoB-like AlkP superfamily enzyme
MMMIGGLALIKQNGPVGSIMVLVSIWLGGGLTIEASYSTDRYGNSRAKRGTPAMRQIASSIYAVWFIGLFLMSAYFIYVIALPRG